MEPVSILTELAIAGLQIWFSAARAAGLTEEEKKALYDQVDAAFLEKSEQELPDAVRRGVLPK